MGSFDIVMAIISFTCAHQGGGGGGGVVLSVPRVARCSCTITTSVVEGVRVEMDKG